MKRILELLEVTNNYIQTFKFFFENKIDSQSKVVVEVKILFLYKTP